MYRLFMILVCVTFIYLHPLSAKDYKASLFGIKSDGITLNTGSIQKAINYINEQGGGRLMFSVGRYLTGSIEMKSGVIIHMEEGAVLVGVESIYDYYHNDEFKALIYAYNQSRIKITGEGVIMGNGNDLRKSIKEQFAYGHLKIDDKKVVSPELLDFKQCDSLEVSGILFMNACDDVLSFSQCKAIRIDDITIKNRGFNGNGLVFSDNIDGVVTNAFIETGGEEIVLWGNKNEVSIVNSMNALGQELLIQE